MVLITSRILYWWELRPSVLSSVKNLGRSELGLSGRIRKRAYVQVWGSANGILEVVCQGVQSLGRTALEREIVGHALPLPVEPRLVDPRVVQEEKRVIWAPRLAADAVGTSRLGASPCKITERQFSTHTRGPLTSHKKNSRSDDQMHTGMRALVVRERLCKAFEITDVIIHGGVDYGVCEGLSGRCGRV